MSDPCVSAIQHDLCAAIICHNDELSSTLSWLEIVSWQSATRYVKVQIMEIKEILVRIWFISANEIKKNSESVSKQSIQLKLELISVTNNCSNWVHKLSSLQDKFWITPLTILQHVSWLIQNQSTIIKYWNMPRNIVWNKINH